MVSGWVLLVLPTVPTHCPCKTPRPPRVWPLDLPSEALLSDTQGPSPDPQEEPRLRVCAS